MLLAVQPDSEMKGLREGCDSNDLWKTFFDQRCKSIRESQNPHTQTRRDGAPKFISGVIVWATRPTFSFRSCTSLKMA
jgi:hypothetical protein